MKRIFSALLCAALLLSLTACGHAPEETPSVDNGADGYPVTVTDQAGRTVTVEAEPQRIVSGYYISTSLLIALDQQDKLVGIEAKADKRPIYRLSAPELLELPNVGSAKEFDLEGCAALEPDLVILPLRLRDAAQTLEELGIPVLLVDPENQTLLDEARDIIAQVTNSGDRARKMAEFTKTQQDQLADALTGTQTPRVYLAGNADFLSTAGGQMYQSDLIVLAGGTNVASDIGEAYWAQIDYEQLLAWDPEYIILASDASYTCEDVLNDPALSACTAVEQGQVYQMPDTAEAWDSPVPGGILGAVWLASVLHPEQCSTEQWKQAAEMFYETFYDFAYSAA